MEWFQKFTELERFYRDIKESNPRLLQTSSMESFVITVNSCKPLTIVAKLSILVVYGSPEYAYVSEVIWFSRELLSRKFLEIWKLFAGEFFFIMLETSLARPLNFGEFQKLVLIRKL